MTDQDLNRVMTTAAGSAIFSAAVAVFAGGNVIWSAIFGGILGFAISFYRVRSNL